jgi:chromosome segregation ATPase
MFDAMDARNGRGTVQGGENAMNIEERIADIEARLQNTAGLSGEQRAELQALLAKLKAELRALSATNADQAHSIAGYVDLSTHELTREEKQPHLLRHAIEGLMSSVAGLEAQHPRLTELVNALSMLLSNTGI